MGSENEIEIYRLPWDNGTQEEVVLLADHVAVRKADQERIAELDEIARAVQRESDHNFGELEKAQASLAAAEKLADAVEELGDGYQDHKWRELDVALNAFRASLSTGEERNAE